MTIKQGGYTKIKLPVLHEMQVVVLEHGTEVGTQQQGVAVAHVDGLNRDVVCGGWHGI